MHAEAAARGNHRHDVTSICQSVKALAEFAYH